MEEQTQTNVNVKGKKKFYKKWWFWLICGLAVVVIVAAIAGSTSGRNTTKNYEVSITGQAYTTQTIGDVYTRTTEELYAVITVSLKNTGNKELSVWHNDFKLVVNGNSYSVSSDGVVIKGLTTFEDIGPGITKQLILVFEIPKATENSAKELQVGTGDFQTNLTVNTISQ